MKRMRGKSMKKAQETGGMSGNWKMPERLALFCMIRVRMRRAGTTCTENRMVEKKGMPFTFGLII
ncbi:MAG: hypothetical protein LUE13_08330 [Akkermansiaceae bacterium]|nr:hypothetical protein [Akkermansiaceae bacterium]